MQKVLQHGIRLSNTMIRYLCDPNVPFHYTRAAFLLCVLRLEADIEWKSVISIEDNITF